MSSHVMRVLQDANTDHCTCLLFSHMSTWVSFLFLSGTFMNMGFICCNPHISCLASTLYLPVPLSSVNVSESFVNRSSFIQVRHQPNLDGSTSNITKSAIWWLYNSPQPYLHGCGANPDTDLIYYVTFLLLMLL